MEKQDDEIYCPECRKPIKKNAIICVNCGIEINTLTEAKDPSLKIEKLDRENLEEEGEKQLGGIKILLYIFVGSLSLSYLAILVNGFIVIFADGDSSGIAAIILGSIFYAAISLLPVFSLIGIKNRKAYTIPLVRAVLVLYCFNLIGLILVLAIFWKRINNSYAKFYLNYFDGSFEIQKDQSTKEYEELSITKVNSENEQKKTNKSSLEKALLGLEKWHNDSLNKAHEDYLDKCNRRHTVLKLQSGNALPENYGKSLQNEYNQSCESISKQYQINIDRLNKLYK